MFLLSALPPILIGLATLVSLRLMYSNSRAAADDVFVLSGTIAGWTMIFLGMAMLTLYAIPIVLLIFAMAVAKYREGEKRALLGTLAVAAEKGMPLAPSARAFAARRCDEMARRAWLLADLLDSGMPLAKALKRSGNPLPAEATLMVQLGRDPKAMAIALRESSGTGDSTEESWRPIFEQTIYLLFVASACVMITVFIMVQIVPTFREIFIDFGVELPAVSQLMIELANRVAGYWYLGLPFLLYVFVNFLIAAFYYACGRVWLPWPFAWIFGKSEHPTVLQGLAVCVEQQLPMVEALRQLGTNYPRVDVGERILNACGTTTLGKDWCESLLEQGIITQSDSAVLKSATKAGNLAWALRELASAGRRRMIYRAKTILAIATPVCLLLIAVPIAFLAFGCFTPLLTLIEEVSGV